MEIAKIKTAAFCFIILCYNASVVKPEKRPARKYHAKQTTNALIAGRYAKIAARFLGLYQPFVRTDFSTSSYKFSSTSHATVWPSIIRSSWKHSVDCDTLGRPHVVRMEPNKTDNADP
jgi:hypothetical protein